MAAGHSGQFTPHAVTCRHCDTHYFSRLRTRNLPIVGPTRYQYQFHCWLTVLTSRLLSQNTRTMNVREKADEPVWRIMWLRRLACLLKPRLHMSHLYGHDPLWTYMWLLRSPGVGNDFEHIEHLCGFSCNQPLHTSFHAGSMMRCSTSVCLSVRFVPRNRKAVETSKFSIWDLKVTGQGHWKPGATFSKLL